MRLNNGQAWLELDPVGATIADAVFCIDHRQVRPFFKNPWRHDPCEMDNLTRHLGGEWPCVPFGVAHPPQGMPADWRCDAPGPDRYQADWHPADWHQHAHGFGAHSVWSLIQQDTQTALAEITYPETSPVTGLRRCVRLVSETEIQLDLEIDARRDAKIPVGLHPVLSLANAAQGTALLEVAGEQTAWTFPQEVEPERSHLQPDQRNVPLSSLLRSDGAPVDASCLPFPTPSEDLVLLSAPGGRVTLVRPDLGYRVDVQWNDSDLPSCLLWLSNRGRDYAPWNGRVCAVGIEPVAAAFDLGIQHSISANTPLARHGIRNFVELSEGETWKTSYAISLHRQ